MNVFVLACTMHNFLRRNHASDYTPPGSLDIENSSVGTINGEWQQNIQLLRLQRVGQNANAEAKNVRDQYVEYFNAEGAVPWQNNMTIIDDE